MCWKIHPTKFVVGQKYAAYGQTYDGMNVLVIYVREQSHLYKILSACKNLTRAEIRSIRERKKG